MPTNAEMPQGDLSCCTLQVCTECGKQHLPEVRCDELVQDEQPKG